MEMSTAEWSRSGPASSDAELAAESLGAGTCSGNVPSLILFQRKERTQQHQIKQKKLSRAGGKLSRGTRMGRVAYDKGGSWDGLQFFGGAAK
jgi:hypothetical protein